MIYVFTVKRAGLRNRFHEFLIAGSDMGINMYTRRNGGNGVLG